MTQEARTPLPRPAVRLAHTAEAGAVHIMRAGGEFTMCGRLILAPVDVPDAMPCPECQEVMPPGW